MALQEGLVGVEGEIIGELLNLVISEMDRI